MSEARSRAKELKRPSTSSPPAKKHETRARAQNRAAVADDDTISSNAVKTDHDILSVAMRDIDLINRAISLRAPIRKLKSGSHVMAAYRDFMRKGREERGIRRPWEHNPNDKLFNEGIQWFSRIIQRYGPWAEQNPRIAKDFVLSQYIDASPNMFGARKPGEEPLYQVPPLHQVPQQAT